MPCYYIFGIFNQINLFLRTLQQMVIVSYKNCQVLSEMSNCKIRFVSLLFNRKLHVLEHFLLSFFDVVIKRLVKLLKKNLL